MQTKELYGNGQRVSKRMMVELEKLEAMCNKYGLRLSCYIEKHSPSLPIVLAVYESDFAVSQLNLRNEEDFLERINIQLEYVNYKYNKSYKHS